MPVFQGGIISLLWKRGRWCGPKGKGVNFVKKKERVLCLLIDMLFLTGQNDLLLVWWTFRRGQSYIYQCPNNASGLFLFFFFESNKQSCTWCIGDFWYKLAVVLTSGCLVFFFTYPLFSPRRLETGLPAKGNCQVTASSAVCHEKKSSLWGKYSLIPPVNKRNITFFPGFLLGMEET